MIIYFVDNKLKYYLLHNCILLLFSSHLKLVNFVCPVRDSHTRALPVVNPTNQLCTIRPIIEGKQWRGGPSLILEPLQNKTYEITYRPLTMTADGKNHLVEDLKRLNLIYLFFNLVVASEVHIQYSSC